MHHRIIDLKEVILLRHTPVHHILFHHFQRIHCVLMCEPEERNMLVAIGEDAMASWSM